MHPEIAGVVDPEDVDPAPLDELGADAAAGAGHHQGPAASDLGAQPIEELPRGGNVVPWRGLLRG